MLGYWLKWFSYKGRIGRKRYWIATLLYLLAWVVGAAILITLAALNYNPPDDTITNGTIAGFVLLGIAMVIFIAVIVARISSVGVRRLHDRGKSGWWLYLYYLAPNWLLKSYWLDDRLILPLAGAALVLWGLTDLGVLRGQPGDNAYGPDPLAGKLNRRTD